jgi:hypothetical protein
MPARPGGVAAVGVLLEPPQRTCRDLGCWVMAAASISSLSAHMETKSSGVSSLAARGRGERLVVAADPFSSTAWAQCAYWTAVPWPPAPASAIVARSARRLPPRAAEGREHERAVRATGVPVASVTAAASATTSAALRSRRPSETAWPRTLSATARTSSAPNRERAGPRGSRPPGTCRSPRRTRPPPWPASPSAGPLPRRPRDRRTAVAALQQRAAAARPSVKTSAKPSSSRSLGAERRRLRGRARCPGDVQQGAGRSRAGPAKSAALHASR